MPWVSAAQMTEFLALQRDLREGRLGAVMPALSDTHSMPGAAIAQGGFPAPARTLSLVPDATPHVAIAPVILEKIAEWAESPRERAVMTVIAAQLSQHQPPFSESHILRVLLNEHTG